MKDQESNPRPHTPRPAALPVKVEQWQSWKFMMRPNIGFRVWCRGRMLPTCAAIPSQSLDPSGCSLISLENCLYETCNYSVRYNHDASAGQALAVWSRS